MLLTERFARWKMAAYLIIFLLSSFVYLVSGNTDTCVYEQDHDLNCTRFRCPDNKCGDFTFSYNLTCGCEVQHNVTVGCQLIKLSGFPDANEVRPCNEYHPFICEDRHNNFQIYDEENMTWADAVETCETRNLHIAQTNNATINYTSDALFWTGVFYGFTSEYVTDVSQNQITQTKSEASAVPPITVKCEMEFKEFQAPTSPVCPSLSTPSTESVTTSQQLDINGTMSLEINTTEYHNISQTESTTATATSANTTTVNTIATKLSSVITTRISPASNEYTQTADSLHSDAKTSTMTSTMHLTTSTVNDSTVATTSSERLINETKLKNVTNPKPTSIPASTNEASQDHKDNTAVIAGAVSGGVVLIIIGAAVVYVRYSRKKGLEKNVIRTSGINGYMDKSLRGKPRKDDQFQNPIYLPTTLEQDDGGADPESDDERKYDFFENKRAEKCTVSESQDKTTRLDIQDYSSASYGVLHQKPVNTDGDVYDHAGALNDGIYGQLHQKDDIARPDSDEYSSFHINGCTRDEYL